MMVFLKIPHLCAQTVADDQQEPGPIQPLRKQLWSLRGSTPRTEIVQFEKHLNQICQEKHKPAVTLQNKKNKCDQAFKLRTKLSEHIKRIHTPGYVTPTPYNLYGTNANVLAHTGERPL
ncbi:hypothetical protein Fcan01_16618 [Folsomia candida]|uniref:Uncharacterized protein n=1 Tax=Folsomia candida TaxID=158441 RepID=A0A226DV83_FOLCA|nr:hypothetical protein Fcan01_16618 [Folsomia candida]